MKLSLPSPTPVKRWLPSVGRPAEVPEEAEVVAEIVETAAADGAVVAAEVKVRVGVVVEVPDIRMGLQIQPAPCISVGGSRVIFVQIHSTAHGKISLRQKIKTNETVTSSTTTTLKLVTSFIIMTSSLRQKYIHYS